MGRAFGAPIVMRLSTLLVLALLVWVLSTSAGLETRDAIVFGIILGVSLVLSVLVHELAHAATARAGGRTVHEIVLTVFGGHTTFDAKGMSPGVAALTALAGPVANGVLAALTAAVYFTVPLGGAAEIIVWWVMWTNIYLGVFNALPGLPLDGGQVLEAVVWGATGRRRTGTVVAGWAGRAIAIAVVLYLIGYPLLTGGTPDIFDALFAFVIFTLLWPAASAAIKRADLIERREAVSAGAIMVPGVPLGYRATLSEALATASATGAQTVIVLADDGVPAGYAPVERFGDVPADQRDSADLRAVMSPLARGALMPAEADAEQLVAEVMKWNGKADAWAVIRDGAPVGVLTLAGAAAALS